MPAQSRRTHQVSGGTCSTHTLNIDPRRVALVPGPVSGHGTTDRTKGVDGLFAFRSVSTAVEAHPAPRITRHLVRRAVEGCAASLTDARHRTGHRVDDARRCFRRGLG